MKVLNINIHFYPESYGGATIVAEKVAHGLLELGHEVYNLCLRINQTSDKDFDVLKSPFGPVIGINNIHLSQSNRFFNSPVASLLYELYEVIAPDKIILHAVQHMGVLTLLENKEVRSKTIVVAHDYYWACLQGFRTLPNGKECTRNINETECKDCSFYPGMTNLIYERMFDLLRDSECVVFPSKSISEGYKKIYGEELPNSRVIQNPDVSEILTFNHKSKTEVSSETICIGYFGGPGYAKGWDVVRKLSSKVKNINDKIAKYVLYDAGHMLGNPWYRQDDLLDNMVIAEPFHWSCAGVEMSKLDAVLMPSRVKESYGLVAREALSLHKKAIIFPGGALSEIREYKGVYATNDDEIIEDFTAAMQDFCDQRTEYNALTSVDYAKRILERVYK